MNETTRIDAVDFYTRPGCGFSVGLHRRLVDAQIPTRVHDIWDDPDAAARVRSVARGNETVPTVFVGDTGLVNPRWGRLLEVLHEQAPHLLPEGTLVPPPRSNLLDRLLGR